MPGLKSIVNENGIFNTQLQLQSQQPGEKNVYPTFKVPCLMILRRASTSFVLMAFRQFDTTCVLDFPTENKKYIHEFLNVFRLIL